MDHEIRKRLSWVKLFKETGDAGLVCRWCGISRPTLRNWSQRFESEGIGGLQEISWVVSGVIYKKTVTRVGIIKLQASWCHIRLNRGGFEP